MVSELVRFVLPRSASSTSAFASLRRSVQAAGIAKKQYFGYAIQDEGFPRIKSPDQMCWYIEWPGTSTLGQNNEFLTALKQISQDKARSLCFGFKETMPGEFIKGLEANFCQLAIINANDKAPRFEADFEHSMDKTFTDCYFAEGFTGGGWSYAHNSNDADGSPLDTGSETSLSEKDRRLAYYVIGWDTLEAHHKYAKTPLFDEEVDKLMPYFGPGTGAFYVHFEKHE